MSQFLLDDGNSAAAASFGERAWYAVHVRSNFEKRVADELGAKGIDSYVPVVEELRQWKDRKKRIAFPVFPGYVFAKFPDTAHARLSVVSTLGAVRILGCGGAIEAVPELELQPIKRLLAANAPLLTHPLLREGAPVRILRGPLRDLEGLLVRIKNQTRLVLSVTLLARSVSTEIDIRDVEPVRIPVRPIHSLAAGSAAFSGLR